MGATANFTCHDGEEFSLYELYGHGKKSNEVVAYFHSTRGRIHPEMMPIGRDHFDNFVCLGFKGERRGKVFFWEKIGLPGDNIEHDLSSTHLVAESFDDFINSIDFEIDSE